MSGLTLHTGYQRNLTAESEAILAAGFSLVITLYEKGSEQF